MYVTVAQRSGRTESLHTEMNKWLSSHYSVISRKAGFGNEIAQEEVVRQLLRLEKVQNSFQSENFSI